MGTKIGIGNGHWDWAPGMGLGNGHWEWAPSLWGHGHCPRGDTATLTQPHVPVVVGGEDGPEHHVLLPDDLQQLEGTQSSGEGAEEVTQTHTHRDLSPVAPGRGIPQNHRDKGMRGAAGWDHAHSTGTVAFLAIFGKAQRGTRSHYHSRDTVAVPPTVATAQATGHCHSPGSAAGGSGCQGNIHGQEQTPRSSQRKEMPESAPNAHGVAQGTPGDMGVTAIPPAAFPAPGKRD